MSTSEPIDLEAAIEALLFASPQPLMAAEISEIFPHSGSEEVERALDSLKARYDAPGRGVRISAVAGGYRITTRPEHAEALARLFQTRNRSRLSRPALETLSVVAYRQPATGPEVAEIRGVNCQAVLKSLLERRLLRIVGRKPVVGRPLLYGTTREFLVHFGLNSLTDLPQVEELQEALAAGSAAPAGETPEVEPDLETVSAAPEEQESGATPGGTAG